MSGLLATSAVAIALVLVVAAAPLLAGGPAVVVPPTSRPSPSAATPAPSPTGPSGLTADVVVESQPLPSGIRTTGLAFYVHFGASLATIDGRPVSTWDVQEGVRSHQTIAAGSYLLRVWRYGVSDNVDTGARVTSPPIGDCSTTITLRPAEAVTLVARFPFGAGACAFQSLPTTASATVDCGPLLYKPGSCDLAVAAAEATFGPTRPTIFAVRIEAPSAAATCPPSGGPPGSHVCDAIAVVVTSAGEVDVGLVRSPDGWTSSNLIR